MELPFVYQNDELIYDDDEPNYAEIGSKSQE